MGAAIMALSETKSQRPQRWITSHGGTTSGLQVMGRRVEDPHGYVEAAVRDGNEDK
jgi:hypothetical protein